MLQPGSLDLQDLAPNRVQLSIPNQVPGSQTRTVNDDIIPLAQLMEVSNFLMLYLTTSLYESESGKLKSK